MQYNDMEYRYIDFHLQVVYLKVKVVRNPYHLLWSATCVLCASRAECFLIISFNAQRVCCERSRRNAPCCQMNCDAADVGDKGGSGALAAIAALEESTANTTASATARRGV